MPRKLTSKISSKPTFSTLHAEAHHHFSGRPKTKCENHPSSIPSYVILNQVVIVESQLQSGTQDDAKLALTQAIQTSKKLIPTIERTSAPRCSMNAAAGMSFHYIIEQNVCFMTIVESAFSSKVAFHYLDDLQKEFWQSHGEFFNSVNNDRLRPFHLQNKFDRFVEKTKSVYLDSRSSQHLAKLNEDLSSTVDVMKTTVDEMMRRGASLDGLSKTSSDIVAGSRQFKSSAQELEFALKLKQFAPLALMIFLILLLVYMVYRRIVG